ncbi:Com family DNA-binding transcriptional regulator [Comamonas odontotermitis]|uniref:Com family DNA-binding transcriptional regulator n=1 Tax=Comamonas odontotermitis TaxID=379895 RepID=UPI00367116F3
MQEIRCGSCGRKLGEGIFQILSIKCPRCGTINSLRALSPTPERPGASDSMKANDATRSPSHTPPRRERL